MPSSRRPNRSRPDLDTDIILAAIRGSGPAFDRLFDHYHRSARHAASRAALVMGYFDDVDELAQEVWCRLLRNDRQLLAYFDPTRGPFGPFIRRLAYQQALATIRWYRRQVPDIGLHGEDDEHEDPRTSRFVADLIQGDLYKRLLERVDAELGERDRMLLREVHLNQRTCRAVANELGLNENTIYKRNERLKKRLAAMVDELVNPNDHHPPPPIALVLMLLGAALAGSTAAGLDDDATMVAMHDA